VLNRGHLVGLGRTSDLLGTDRKLEITARGIARDSFPGAEASDRVVRFKVPAEEQRAALERVWNLGGEVVSVNPVRRSLEQLFLELTRSSRPGKDIAS
jgi:hypothetical protein